jgi:2,6-dihydroxypyridine 3-monooxygenase
LIAGGSIGGLTAGILLHELGHDVQIFERAGTALQERGTGIVVLPITERYFAERRGDDGRVSLELTYWSYVDRTGAVTSAEPDHYRFSGWQTVYRALLDAFDPDRYHLDSQMVGFDRRDDGVTLHLRDGRAAEGDLLICADGMASTARSILLPEVVPAYAGYVAWRFITDERVLSVGTKELLADAMVYQVLDHSHILVYAIPDRGGATEPGRRIVNSVWYRNYSNDGPLQALMTDRDGVRRAATMPPGSIRQEFIDEMRATARTVLAPQVLEAVDACSEPLLQAVNDLEVPRMAFGRVCLIGDAAFGLRPHVAAGAAKACADAWALRDALVAAGGDIDSALALWEPKQLLLGQHAVERSRAMGIRSQVENRMVPGDPAWKFGLWKAGN